MDTDGRATALRGLGADCGHAGAHSPLGLQPPPRIALKCKDSRESRLISAGAQGHNGHDRRFVIIETCQLEREMQRRFTG